VTFHQSYSYEDFIEGIKPVLDTEDVDEDGRELEYEIKPGVFKKLCETARRNPHKEYALFIDEINRGNVAQIFGELITLIEDDKRAGEGNVITARLPYSKTEFSVPSNLSIIGTMNTADRSVEALDTALRRRFSFIEMNPDTSVLKVVDGVDLPRLLQTINDRIETLLNKDYCIGHSYLMNIESGSAESELKKRFENKIIPLLQEYFYGDWSRIAMILGKEFIAKKEINTKLKDPTEDYLDHSHEIYEFTDPESWTLETFKSIYEEESN
jgi:5-methylcytosine-specific restriction endonuclease McrBC GTP-binding regulatory subunit McrB